MPISLAPQLTQRSYQWSGWKVSWGVKGGQHQFEEETTIYTVWFYDGPEVHLCTLWKGVVPDGVIGSGYTQEQNDADRDDFEANFKPTGNRPIVAKLPDGRPRTSSEKSTSVRRNFYSHDWTDPTTWYEQSTYVASETATDSGDHLTYTLAHHNVIDLYHGKITLEDSIVDANGHSYRVHVSVNGVAKVEQDPHFGTGGDFTVDYAGGKVVFLVALDPADVVTVGYHYASGSRFTVKPPAGLKLSIEQAEVQFSTDIDLKDSMVFEAFGIADYFLSPAQMAAYGIPAGVGYKISLQKFTYKSFSDFQNDAFKAYPSYPAMGDPSNWRSQKQAVTVFDWDYLSSLYLYSSKGMEIRLYLQHDTPCTGWMATATMYCTVDSDS